MKWYVFDMFKDLSEISVMLDWTKICLVLIAVRMRNEGSEMWVKEEKSLASR